MKGAERVITLCFNRQIAVHARQALADLVLA